MKKKEEPKFDITAKNHIPIFDDPFYDNKAIIPLEAKNQQFKYDNLHDAKEISSKITVVESRQETLEEAALRLFPDNSFWIGSGLFARLYDPNYLERQRWIEGAKWQQQQEKNLYSEEEVRKSLLDIVLVNPAHITMLKSGYGEFPDTYELTEKGVDYIVEQFKKK
jgi:hypothetical protein